MTPGNLGRALVVLIMVAAVIGATSAQWIGLWETWSRSRFTRTLGPYWTAVWLLEFAAVAMLAVEWYATGLVLSTMAIVFAALAIWRDQDWSVRE